MKRPFLSLALIAAVAASNAQLVWDHGPATGSHGGFWSNSTAGQNFADLVSFASATTVLRYRHFTLFDPSTYGTMTVKLLDDNAGAPGNFLSTQSVPVFAYGFAGNFGGNDVFWADLNLTTALNLSANTNYWIGASGNGFEAGQLSVLTPQDGQMAQFTETTFSHHAGIGDQTFQLYADAIPEPTTLALLGIGAVAMLRRRKN